VKQVLKSVFFNFFYLQKAIAIITNNTVSNKLVKTSLDIFLIFNLFHFIMYI